MKHKALRFGKGFRVTLTNRRAQAAEMVLAAGETEGGPANRYRQAMTPVSLITRPDGVLDVVLRGEIDYTNAGPVTDAVRTAVERDHPAAVQVDLTEVTFLDSSGIGGINKSRARARRRKPNVLARPPFDPTRLFVIAARE